MNGVLKLELVCPARTAVAAAPPELESGALKSAIAAGTAEAEIAVAAEPEILSEHARQAGSVAGADFEVVAASAVVAGSLGSAAEVGRLSEFEAGGSGLAMSYRR